MGDRVFQDGYVYVFSKKKYLNDNINNKKSEFFKGSWQRECVGKIVENINNRTGKIGCWTILPEWCKAIRRVK